MSKLQYIAFNKTIFFQLRCSQPPLGEEEIFTCADVSFWFKTTQVIPGGNIIFNHIQDVI